MAETGKPLLVIMGAEEQIIDDPAKRLAAYRATVPGAETKLISGAGHSPNVEKPAETAALVLGFASAAKPATKPNERPKLQKPVQKRTCRPEAPLESNLCSIRRQISANASPTPSTC